MNWLTPKPCCAEHTGRTSAGPAGGDGTPSRWQRSFSEVEALDCRSADQRLAYGPAEEQFVDVWLPPGDDDAPWPVVILIHGGCWLAEYDIGHIRPLAGAIAGSGFAVWGVEYRRVGQPGGGWPGTFEDIATAVDLLAQYRHPRLDAGRVTVVGHSAGGHLALWAAGRSRLRQGQELYQPQPLRPCCVIGLAAITDLAAYGQGENSCQAVTPLLMGGTADEVPGRYAQASPAELGSDVPVTLLHGDSDIIVPPGQAGAIGGARQVLLEGAGHFDLIHTGTPAFRRIIQLLRSVGEQ